MKNEIQKVMMLTIILTGSMTQIGCGKWGEYEVCDPDGLDQYAYNSNSIIKKYNGETLELYGSIGVDIDTGNIKIDNGAVQSIEDMQLSFDATNSNHHFLLKDFPLNKGDKKNYATDVTIDANYYSIKNITNGNVQSWIPVSDSYNYQGWYDSTSAILQHGRVYLYGGDNYVDPVDKILLRVTDPTTASFELESLNEIQRPIVKTFPDVSPLGDLQIELATSKKWTGTTKVKILENENFKFHIAITIELTDGRNILEETIDRNYKIVPASCHMESSWGT